MFIDSAKYTCPGGREINEDACLCRGDKGIFIVADGLGGHSSGEIASGTAIDYFEENCTGGYTGERIAALMEGANAQVLQYGNGGKTTVAAAFIENGNFIYANAGDSRVYYFRDGKIIAQTKDHSVCQASVDMGMIQPEDIRGSEDRSRLLKVLGGEENLAIKKHDLPIRIQNGDAFLVCTDGFWDYVYEAEMEADLLKSDSAEVWLKYMLKRHILRAENKGDNYTAICGIIHIEPGDHFAGADTGVNSRSAVSAVQKKNFPLKIVIISAAVLLAAAVIVLGILLFGGSGDDPEATDTPVETPDESASETTPDTTPEESASDTTVQAEEATTGDPKTENTTTAEPKTEDTTAAESKTEESTTAADVTQAEDSGDVTTTQEPEETAENTTPTAMQEEPNPEETTVADEVTVDN